MMRRGPVLLLASVLVLTATLAVRAAARDAPAPSDAIILGDESPARLSQFGFFADGTRQLPAEHVLPYRLNMPLYSDGADKLRFLYIPPGGKIAAEGDGLLKFPVGSALIKTFAFGEGAARRLIETRVLLHRSNGWVALPYRWNAEQTDAVLALAGGRVEIETAADETISYRIPNKNQCKECHGLDGAVVPIGPKARNLDRDWLARLGLAPAGADSLPVWEERAGADAAKAARAYLDVNCAHCHRPGAAASNSGLDLRWEQDDPVRLGVLKRPVAAGRGSGGFDFDIDPGHPERSILTYRMGSREPGVAMPELGKSTVDADGLALIERWIREMEYK
ncbi:SO2930 family diheme c-type cytochrome [Parerythrobacter aurantius]|uniref:SO2930 family diheme c-type cytochrome n=1 Tax=Parerythrobacter aurantius TaxID=3127706 RepID=UPI0032536E6A